MIDLSCETGGSNTFVPVSVFFCLWLNSSTTFSNQTLFLRRWSHPFSTYYRKETDQGKAFSQGYWIEEREVGEGDGWKKRGRKGQTALKIVALSFYLPRSYFWRAAHSSFWKWLWLPKICCFCWHWTISMHSSACVWLRCGVHHQSSDQNPQSYKQCVSLHPTNHDGLCLIRMLSAIYSHSSNCSYFAIFYWLNGE